ncbi:MAG: succinate dehydrogenase cytochrome b subunit [Bacteroidetes bacterium]|nr:succinate dehydrogenase cytochrome b subunit [Bacteroidota bacterium]
MNKALDFYYSSIGKKVLMSVTGLFLIVFLTEHLIGNLLLFAGDEGKMYEAYGDFLVSNPVIRFIELFMFLGIFVHIIIGVILWFKNRKTRSVKYKLFRLKDNATLASRTTIISGLVIGIFLYIHLTTFFFPLRYSDEKSGAYELVVNAFSDFWYVIFYLAALFVIAYHLHHGFQSAFQTLGLRNKKYAPVLDIIAFFVWCLIPLGFAAIPIYFFFFHGSGATVIMWGF